MEIVKDRIYNCIDCGKKLVSYYATRCRSCSKKGKLNYNWKGGRRVRSDGYILIFCPEHINRTHDNYMLEHRLVMEKYLGRHLKTEEVVHHIDGNRANNKLENLILFPTHSAHQSFKHTGESKYICKHCGKNQKDK